MPWQPNKLEHERLDKLKKLQERGINPFPNNVMRTHTITAAISAFETADKSAAESDPAIVTPIEVTVCGRIRSVRITGKVTFAHIEDGTGRVQLFIQQNNVGEALY